MTYTDHGQSADGTVSIYKVFLSAVRRSFFSLSQAEFTSRGTSVVGALRNIGYPVVRIEGGLHLSPLLQDTEDLLLQAYNFTYSTSVQV